MNQNDHCMNCPEFYISILMSQFLFEKQLSNINKCKIPFWKVLLWEEWEWHISKQTLLQNCYRMRARTLPDRHPLCVFAAYCFSCLKWEMVCGISKWGWWSVSPDRAPSSESGSWKSWDTIVLRRIMRYEAHRILLSTSTVTYRKYGERHIKQDQKSTRSATQFCSFIVPSSLSFAAVL